MELEVTLVFVAVSLLNVFLLNGTVLWYRCMHECKDGNGTKDKIPKWTLESSVLPCGTILSNKVLYM